jgi:hypothetical protein
MAGVNAYETGTVIFGEGLLGLVPRADVRIILLGLWPSSIILA